MGFRVTLLIFSLLFFLLFSLVGDEGTFGMKEMISVENLKQHVRNIHFDRNPYGRYHELEQAAQYIRGEFLKIGMEVKEDLFQWEGRFYKNIVAEKKGMTSPDKVLILGAHYDTVAGSPGADDNTSAIAVLLEVGRNIQTVPLGSTLKLITFSLEEYDYAGSTHYVENARKREEMIVGMVSLEMVGFTGLKQNYPHYLNPKKYPNVGDFIGIIGNNRSKTLMERVRRSFKTHIPQLPSEFLLVPGNGEGMEETRLSDHSPFWDQGFPALMVTDTAFLRNPNYHLPSDTIDTLDFEFMRKVAIGIFYSILDLAE
jgi:Zn-dependent M28 family amino/carboxypeptidase